MRNAYNKANREKVLAQRRAWREKNKERQHKKEAQWRKENREKIRSQSRLRYQRDETMFLQNKKWREENPQLVRASQRACSRRKVAELRDTYIKYLLTQGTVLKRSDIPPELVAVKKMHLKIQRKLNQTKP